MGGEEIDQKECKPFLTFGFCISKQQERNISFGGRGTPEPAFSVEPEREWSEGDGNSSPPISLYPKNIFGTQIKSRSFNRGLRNPLSVSTWIKHVKQAGIWLGRGEENWWFSPCFGDLQGLIYALQTHDLIHVGLASLLIIAACKKLLRIPRVFLFWVKKIKSISK